MWAILAPAVQEIYDNCKFFIAPYTPSPDFDKNTTAEELLTTFGMGRNPVVSLWIYTKDDTVGKDTDMQQLTSKIQAMGYSVDVGVYYLSEENYEVVNEDDYLNYNICCFLLSSHLKSVQNCLDKYKRSQNIHKNLDAHQYYN